MYGEFSSKMTLTFSVSFHLTKWTLNLLFCFPKKESPYGGNTDLVLVQNTSPLISSRNFHSIFLSNCCHCRRGHSSSESWD